MCCWSSCKTPATWATSCARPRRLAWTAPSFAATPWTCFPPRCCAAPWARTAPADGALRKCPSGRRQALHDAGLCLWGAALREDAVPLSGAGELCGAVAVGNEGHGLSGEMLDLCDKLVVIPMKGQTESLSAPCAAAILLWELWGRRDAGC